ncbi:MAG: DUF4388 domain-containing protein [Deltaproteobacteria bacterium]|nr:MAG: DUF4388 domain-containing protein [Deltaproteobacteria bacterium]
MDVPYLPSFRAEGKLEELPLPVLVMHMLSRKATGMLYVESGGTTCWMYFEEGFPAGVHNPKSQDFLGQVLRELGYIDDNAFNQSLMEMAKTKRLQGQILLEMGAIDEQKLEQALGLQVARKMSKLFALKQGSFRFAEEEELPPPQEPIRINPFALVYSGIKGNYGQEDLKKALQVLVGKSCRFSGKFVERKDLFDFPPDDLADLELLREFRLPQEFVRGVRSGPVAGMMLLATLMYCGMLELEEAEFAQPIPGVARTAGTTARSAAPRQAVTPRASPSQPAASRSDVKPSASAARPRAQQGQRQAAGVSPDLQRKINEKYEQIKTAPLWKVLEVEKDAPSEAIKRSFITLAKVYHPDRVSKSGDSDLIHRMETIFARLNEAYQVLSDPNKRAEYEKRLAAGGDAAVATSRPQDARVQYQKGIVFLRKKDYKKAAESFRWAAELEPENGEYQTWKSWTAYLAEGDQSEQRLLQLRDELVGVGKKFPDCFIAFKQLARVYQKLGDNDRYHQALVQANKLNPKDVEVARELRLWNMRRQKQQKKGLFGKLKR